MPLKKSLANLLMFPVPAVPGPGEATGGLESTSPNLESMAAAGETKNAPVFANYKAVTFPGLVVVIGGAWTGLQKLDSRLDKPWVPFLLCMVLGGFLTWLEVTEDQVTPTNRKAFGALIGFCNCLVLFSAVVGGSTLLDGGAKPPVNPTAVAPAGNAGAAPLPAVPK